MIAGVKPKRMILSESRLIACGHVVWMFPPLSPTHGLFSISSQLSHVTAPVSIYVRTYVVRFESEQRHENPSRDTHPTLAQHPPDPSTTSNQPEHPSTADWRPGRHGRSARKTVESHESYKRRVRLYARAVLGDASGGSGRARGGLLRPGRL